MLRNAALDVKIGVDTADIQHCKPRMDFCILMIFGDFGPFQIQNENDLIEIFWQDIARPANAPVLVDAWKRIRMPIWTLAERILFCRGFIPEPLEEVHRVGTTGVPVLQDPLALANRRVVPKRNKWPRKPHRVHISNLGWQFKFGALPFPFSRNSISFSLFPIPSVFPSPRGKGKFSLSNFPQFR